MLAPARRGRRACTPRAARDVTLVTAPLLPSAHEHRRRQAAARAAQGQQGLGDSAHRLSGATLGSRHRARRSRICSGVDPADGVRARDLTPDPAQALARRRLRRQPRRPVRRGVVAAPGARRVAAHRCWCASTSPPATHTVIADDPDADLCAPGHLAGRNGGRIHPGDARRHRRGLRESRCAACGSAKRFAEVATDWDRWPTSVTLVRRRCRADRDRRRARPRPGVRGRSRDVDGRAG